MVVVPDVISFKNGGYRFVGDFVVEKFEVKFLDLVFYAIVEKIGIESFREPVDGKRGFDTVGVPVARHAYGYLIYASVPYGIHPRKTRILEYLVVYARFVADYDLGVPYEYLFQRGYRLVSVRRERGVYRHVHRMLREPGRQRQRAARRVRA